MRCALWRILDVLVDLRRESTTFGRWEGVRVERRDHRQLYCADRFAYGCVLSDVADVIYKTSACYDPAAEAASPTRP